MSQEVRNLSHTRNCHNTLMKRKEFFEILISGIFVVDNQALSSEEKKIGHFDLKVAGSRGKKKEERKIKRFWIFGIMWHTFLVPLPVSFAFYMIPFYDHSEDCTL